MKLQNVVRIRKGKSNVMTLLICSYFENGLLISLFSTLYVRGHTWTMIENMFKPEMGDGSQFADPLLSADQQNLIRPYLRIQGCLLRSDPRIITV
jgi:hypothetical protein